MKAAGPQGTMPAARAAGEGACVSGMGETAGEEGCAIVTGDKE